MKQRIGFSLLQIQLLMIQNGIKYDEDSFKAVVESLNKYRNINIYLIHIITGSLNNQDYRFSFQLLENYIDDKIQKQD